MCGAQGCIWGGLTRAGRYRKIGKSTVVAPDPVTIVTVGGGMSDSARVFVCMFVCVVFVVCVVWVYGFTRVWMCGCVSA